MRPRGIGIAVLSLLTTLPAQREEPRQQLSPAAQLYRLVIEEWTKVRAKGVQMPTHRARARRPLGVLGGLAVVEEEQPESWKHALEASVLPRNLLMQATAAPMGPLLLGDDIDKARAHAMLGEVLELARQDAIQRRQTDAESSLTIGIALLRHARRLTEGADIDAFGRRHDLADQAANLIATTCPHLREGHDSNGLLDRCARELTYFLPPDDRIAALEKTIRATTNELLVRHRPRLRDVFQTTPGGYDEKAMQKRISAEIERVLAACRKQAKDSLSAWANQLEIHCKEQRTLGNTAAATADKAMRGMVYLNLCSFEKTAKELGRRTDEIEEALAALRRRKR